MVPVLLNVDFQSRQVSRAKLRSGVTIDIDLAVLFFQHLPVALAEKISLRACLAVKLVGIHVQQPHQRVARDDVEINIGQGFKLIDRLRGGHQGQKKAQSGDFCGLFHDIHAKKIVGDDAALDEVSQAFVLGFPLCNSTRWKSVRSW